jgi:hypothetical protein
VLRNAKEYKRSSIKDKDDKDDEEGDNNNHNSNKDNDEDEDNDIELDKSNKDSNFKKDDSNKDEDLNNITVNALPPNPNCNNLVKTICYKDVNLILLLNPTRTCDLLALKINL